MSIKIVKVETRPEPDPFHTGNPTVTTLHLDPAARTVHVLQEMRDGSTPSDIWHGIRLALALDGHPQATRAREWLESPDVQTVLEAVCEGHSTRWNGSNHVGWLTEEAAAAWDGLDDSFMRECTDMGDDWELWDADTWLHESMRQHITAETSDEEIERLAEEWERDAERDHVILSEDVAQTLRDYRDSRE